MNKQKGQMTILFSLIAGILLSLFLILTEGARMHTMRMQIECVTDMGLDSLFAEFHREMLNQYDLFFIDTSYGTQTASLSNTENHLQAYMSQNLNQVEALSIEGAKDWLGLSVTSVVIGDVSLACDENGEVLRQQAIEYMKDKLGMSYLQVWQDSENITSQYELLSQGLTEEYELLYEQIEERLDEISGEAITEGKWVEEKWREVGIGEIVAHMSDYAIGELLSCIINDTDVISKTIIDVGNCLSSRDKNVGIGTAQQAADSAAGEFLFGEYLLQKCGCYTNVLEKSEMCYQIEYILYGQPSDAANLEQAAEQLLLFRQTMDITYLHTDVQKVEEAGLMAAKIAAGIGQPELQPLLQEALLLKWARAEAAVDVSRLINDGKVPLIKTSSDWKLSLSEMFYYKKFLGSKETEDTQEGGLTYEEYLRLFLHVMNSQDKINRFMNLIEMDIRKTEGNRYFRLDACVGSLTAEVEVCSSLGHNYRIKRTYRYE